MVPSSGRYRSITRPRDARSLDAVSQPARPFEVVRTLDPPARGAVQSLVRAVTRAGAHTPVARRRLEHALHGTAPGFLGALAWNDDHSALVGYVQAVRSVGGWDVECVIEPGIADSRHEHPNDLLARLVSAVVDGLAAENDGEVRVWAYQVTELDDRLAARLGLMAAREIRQMRRTLPVEEHTRRSTAELVTRSFEIGHDEEAWLELNNRAFAGHPEQGQWGLDELRALEREPWFDPNGFLLHEVDGRLAGFCWTKVHADAQPPMGEIYVIGVEPRHQTRGLGRALVLAGLDYLTRTGLTTAMLYVDATNLPAVSLYESMGFEVHHVDRVYHLV